MITALLQSLLQPFYKVRHLFSSETVFETSIAPPFDVFFHSQFIRKVFDRILGFVVTDDLISSSVSDEHGC